MINDLKHIIQNYIEAAAKSVTISKSTEKQLYLIDTNMGHYDTTEYTLSFTVEKAILPDSFNVDELLKEVIVVLHPEYNKQQIQDICFWASRTNVDIRPKDSNTVITEVDIIFEYCFKGQEEQETQ